MDMKSDYSPKAMEILQCARALLAAGGYTSFSYADIADTVHITKASIHGHFATKADLVRVVVTLYRQEALAGMAALDAQIDDPLEQLRAYIAFWTTCLNDRTSSYCICAMLAAELPTLPPLVAEEVRGHFQDLTHWLAAVMDKGSKAGTFNLKTDPRSEAMAFIAVVHGAMLAARAYGDAQIFAAIMDPALRHLAPQA
jgi:TetR/AcrR family transcriptional regulator, transcriptional repressor for nem operon